MNRYDLTVLLAEERIYFASYSSINHLVKFACGFDRSIVELIAYDTVFDKALPIVDLCEEFEGAIYGI